MKMVIDKPLIISIIFILVVTMSQSGCSGFCSPGNQDNRLNLTGGTVTITPDSDSIRVGDTLWLRSVIPTQLIERSSTGDSSKIDFNGATNVVTDFHIMVPVVADSIIDGIDSFKYFTIHGSVKVNPSAPHAAKTVYYVDNGDSYQFSMGLIAEKKGIYVLSYIDIYQAEKKCVFASIEVLMNNKDNHQHYLSGIHYPGSPYGDTSYPIEITHEYCFKVY